MITVLAPNLNAVGGTQVVVLVLLATGTGCNLIGQCVGEHVASAEKEDPILDTHKLYIPLHLKKKKQT